MAILVITYDTSTGGFRTQKIGSAQISDGAIVSAKIGVGEIGTPHLADLAVVSGKVKQSDISLALLGERAHGSLTGVTANLHHVEFTSGMHNFAHPSALIGTGAITSAKIAANAIGGAHILAGSIPSGDLANQAVTSAKIGALAVGTPHLAANAIVSGKIVQSDIHLALLGERGHGSLTGITAEQHHAEFTSGQHRSTTQHPLGTVVPHDALASLTEKAHGSLTGVTANLHHAEFTSGMHNFPHPSALIAALAITSGKVASGGLAPLTSGKIWAGFTGDFPREEDKPVAGWTPTGNGGTKVAGADCEAALKDPVAATAGLRTLGTGAQQAAAGNHTHTLAEDVLGTEFSATSTNAATGARRGHYMIGGADETLVTKTLTFAALSRAVAVGVGSFSVDNAGDFFKIRLFMDGVQMAESGYLGQDNDPIVLVGTKALSGSKTCYISAHNYSGSGNSLYIHGCYRVSHRKEAVVIGIGSIKI